MKLDYDFYRRHDVNQISRDLLGKYLCTRINGKFTSGKIVETEAYAGATDKASHAWRNRRTKRTEIMYHTGGVSYVYLCYGIHYMFNVITNLDEIPHAVLIRAIEPAEGIEFMLKRRGLQQVRRNLTGGPGMLTQALGITLDQDGLDLRGSAVWIEDKNNRYRKSDIITSPRVGVSYAGADALKPWRYRLKDSNWTSKPF